MGFKQTDNFSKNKIFFRREKIILLILLYNMFWLFIINVWKNIRKYPRICFVWDEYVSSLLVHHEGKGGTFASSGFSEASFLCIVEFHEWVACAVYVYRVYMH